MDTLNLVDRSWKGPSETSPQQGGGVEQPFRRSTTWRAHFPTVGNVLARVRRIHVDRPGNDQNRRWIFSRESSRIPAVIPVTISGIDEHGGIFREATQTIDVSRRGARIATSNALPVGTYLRIESPSMEKPAVAQVVRYAGRSRPDSPRDICVVLLVDNTNNIWGLKPTPEDWLNGLGEPSSAQRLEQVLGSEWAARFKSISNGVAPPTGFAEGMESQHKPAPASRKPKVPPSSSEKWSAKGPASVTHQPEEPVHVSAPTRARTDEGALWEPDQIRKVATSGIEERLAGVSLAVEALEGRVGALVEDFQGRLEGTLRAFQEKGARQAEDLEKIAQDLGGRWSQQFQEQAEAALKRLREELKNSGRLVEEGKQQLASLTEAKLASLSQATREEYGQQLAQAFRERAQVMHEAADGEVESIKQAAQQAIAQLQAAEQKRETGFVARAGAAEERLTGVSLAVEALEGRVGALVEDFRGQFEGTLQAFQGKGARQAEDLEKIAQDLGGRWSQQFQEQAEAALKRLREELKNSGQLVEEGKQQLASLTEAKLASLSQATREEYGQQLAQAFRERAQVMHEAADGEVESIKQAAQQAIAQLQAAEQKRETGFVARAGAAEERLTGVSLAVEALEGRVGALVEDFRGQFEGTLQAFQGKGARQAEDLEKIAQDLGGRWSQQFQEQAEAALKRLREELKNSGQLVEEGKQQLASLTEAKLASLSQATREEYGQQLAQAFREHAQVMHEAADGEVESIKQAAQQAIAQLQAAEQKRETGFVARAGAAEERLAGVSLAVETLEGRVVALAEDFRGRLEGTLQAFQGKGARQAEDLAKIAQHLGGQWSQQFQEQAEAALKRLREELKNSGRLVEEGKQQLASLTKAKLVSLSQVADNATAGLEAEQRRLKKQYENSRRGLEELLERGSTKPPSPSLQYETRPKRRGIVAQQALVAGLCLVITVPVLGVYLSRGAVMQLQPEAPAEFIEQSPNWNAKRRAREEEVAQAYWQVAVVSLQQKYPFGSGLPADPPPEFQIDNKYVAPGGAKAFSETRAIYWENLRRSWVQPQSWVERHEWNTQWAARLRHIWDQSNSPK
jgi:ABC-type cobalt transport system substrate-binding protein